MSRLTHAEIGALHEALDDEYKAWTTYDQVIHDFDRLMRSTEREDILTAFENLRRASQERHLPGFRRGGSRGEGGRGPGARTRTRVRLGQPMRRPL